MRLIWIYIHIYIIIYTYRNHIKSNHGIAMRICHGEILRNLMGWIMMIHWPEKFKFRPWLGIVAPIQFSLQSEFSTLQHTSTTAGSGVAPLTDVVIFTIVVGRGATDTVTLRFRYPVWFGECSQRSPPKKKQFATKDWHTPKQTNGGSYNPGLTPNIFSWCMMMHPQAKESWSVVSLAKVSCLIALLTPWSCFRVFETMVCYLQLDIPTIDRFYQSSHGNLPRVGLLSKHFPMDRKTLNSSIHTRYSTSDFGR